jgi:hypothetical protein
MHVQAFCKDDGMFTHTFARCIAAVVFATLQLGTAAQQPSQDGAVQPTVQDQELVLGAWELDLSRSMFSPGPPPRSEIRRYQEEHEGIKAEILTVNADGSKIHMEYVASFNDVVAVVTGSQQTDAIRMRKIDPYTAESQLSLGGRPVGSARRVVSRDGQTLTITLDRTAPAVVHNVEVFRRVGP